MEATFTTNDITLHLSHQYPYAATCFAQDMLQHGDTVEALTVQTWIKRYFPTHSALMVYRNIAANCTKTIYAHC